LTLFEVYGYDCTSNKRSCVVSEVYLYLKKINILIGFLVSLYRSYSFYYM